MLTRAWLLAGIKEGEGVVLWETVAAKEDKEVQDHNFYLWKMTKSFLLRPCRPRVSDCCLFGSPWCVLNGWKEQTQMRRSQIKLLKVFGKRWIDDVWRPYEGNCRGKKQRKKQGKHIWKKGERHPWATVMTHWFVWQIKWKHLWDHERHVKVAAGAEEVFLLGGTVRSPGRNAANFHFLGVLSANKRGRPLLSRLQFLRYAPSVLPCD